MIVVPESVAVLAEVINSEAVNESEIYPVDRKFLTKYYNQIMELNKLPFIYYNFEKGDPTYSMQLTLCLPEMWKEISVDDIEVLFISFTNIFSFYALLEFSYKYIEVDLFDLFFKSDVSKDVKIDVKEYFINSGYPNLIKSDSDYMFLDKTVLGINYSDWMYIKQKLLIDGRIKPALQSIDEIKSIVQKYL